ncbi:kunitz-type serine protease inhibitor 6-like [Littorina saxatilis]|uniref:kunitz-type serine protease inhibitor 6-like n=1 Tax=Littorina saxatilis TaxID=31220 RepID=UPI0038B4722A
MTCVWTPLHVLYSALLVLLVVSTLTRASSFMRAHGAKELWPYFQIRCDLNCPYGYMTDVEGNFVCYCHDPCQNVRCFRRTQCVVDLPKACLPSEYCRPKATCKDLSPPEQPPPQPSPTSTQHSVPQTQADDATTTSSETSLPERCLLPVTGEAKKCRNTRMRWYYDDITGTCKSFLGCKTTGNNFRGRRGCEKTCGVKRSLNRNRTRYPLIQADDASLAPRKNKSLQRPAICSLPAIPVTIGCKRTRRRWFFDAKTGTCRKFRSCRTPGNSFSKKRHCKRTCLSAKSSRRKGRRNETRSANQ